MNKYIVTTTINSPTEATLKFCQKKDWKFIIVGDTKTPHEEYNALVQKYNNVEYLSPQAQENNYKELSDVIGWKSIQRRNIGLVEAYKQGADVIATVDDDNIPYPDWGENIYIGKTIKIDCYHTDLCVFDPLSVTKSNYLWHRGYPIELLTNKNDIEYLNKLERRVLVQADLWDGDPDIDAIARIAYHPEVSFKEIKKPYCSDKISPFNSQNTFLSREVIPYYSVIPHIGRMDDIWGAYIMQKYFPNSVVYNAPTVYQSRNVQDLVKNLENEVIGYRNTLNLIQNLEKYESFLPEQSLKYLKIYSTYFK